MSSIQRQCKTLIEGKPTRDATAARFQQLKAMALDPDLTHDKAKKLEYDQAFDAMIERLRDYEQEHGDCLVKRRRRIARFFTGSINNGGNIRSFGFTSFVD